MIKLDCVKVEIYKFLFIKSQQKFYRTRVIRYGEIFSCFIDCKTNFRDIAMGDYDVKFRLMGNYD
jgi:hypothetical protein